MAHVVLCVQNLSVPKDPRVWREARTLAAAGHDVAVICPRDAGLSRRETLEGVRIRRYAAPPERPGWLGLVLESIYGLLGTTWRLLRELRHGRIDVLHVAAPPDSYFVLGWFLKPMRTKFVYDQHDPSPELLHARFGHRPVLDRILRFLEQRSLHCADLVISVNGSMRRLALRRGGLPDERAVVIRIGPDDVTPVETRERRDPPVVAFAGEIEAVDGVDCLVQAVATALAAEPGLLTLDVIGRGSEVPALVEQAAALGIADRVEFPGWLTRPDLRDRLLSASVAVLPGEDTELNRIATPVKISEYLALGLPCVVFDTPENRVTCRDAVRYYRAGDADDLAANLVAFARDPQLRAEYGERARERAKHLLWGPSGERLVAAYAELTEGGPPVARDYEP